MKENGFTILKKKKKKKMQEAVNILQKLEQMQTSLIILWFLLIHLPKLNLY